MGAITKWSFLLFSSVFFVATLQAQYPATGNKQRLGWQTTGDGLVYRGAIADTSTLDPSGLNNAWMLLDTVSGSLYAYRSKAWQLVSGGGGGVSMPFDSVTFNINEGDASEQELKYSAEKGYLQYGGLDSVQIPLLPGIWYVRNDTSVTIPKGTVVRASGTLGASGRIKVKHMIADGSIPAMYVLGIAMQDIAVGADGYVMTQGKIRQVNTTAYSEGAVLYADVDTLGGLTQTEPGNGYLKLPIAFVVNSAANGTLAVRIDAGSSLRDLHDVDTTGRVNGSVLQYNDTLKYWKASTTAGIVAGDTSVFARDFQINGTGGYIPKFTTSSTIANSALYNPAGNKLMVGHTTANVFTNGLEIHSASNDAVAQPSIDVILGNTNFADYTPRFQLYRNRSTTLGAVTKVNQGDWLGRLMFNGADGAKYVTGAQVYALTDATTGLDSMPTALRFATNPGNTLTPTDRMSITSAGRVGIGIMAPDSTLHVSGSSRITGNMLLNGRLGVGDASTRFKGYFVGNGSGAGVPDTGVYIVNNSTSSGPNVGLAVRQTSPSFQGTNTAISGYAQRHGNSVATNTGVWGWSRSTDLNAYSANIGIRGEIDTSTFTASGYNTSTFAGYFKNNMAVAGNHYGVYIETASGGDYGIYQTGTGVNYLAGRLGIGITSPSRSLHISATDAVRIPRGTTSDRGTGANGDIRYSTTNNIVEWYDTTGNWRQPVISASATGFGTAGRFAQFKAGGLDTSDVIRQVGDKIAIDTSAADSTLTVAGSAKISEGLAAKHFRPLVSGAGARPDIGMWSNAANVLNFSTSNTSRMQIGSTGSVSITANTTGSVPTYGLTSNRGISAVDLIFMSGATNSTPQLTVQNNANDQSGGYVVFQKSRSSATVQNGDELGTFSWGARRSVNAAVYASAGFRAAVNGTVTSDFVPVDFTIFTSPNTDGAPNYVPVKTDRLTVKPNGNVGIGTSSPTATLQLKAGTASANTAPLKFTSGTNLSTPEVGAVEWDGSNLFISNSTPTRQTVNQGLTATFVYDFGSISANSYADITLSPVTGAVSGDVVSVGVPNAAITADIIFFAWVSSNDTITLRCVNNSSTTARNPASGTYKFFVTKF